MSAGVRYRHGSVRAATKAMLCLPFCLGALAGCGGGDDGGASSGGEGEAVPAKELAAMLPDGGMPQAVAVDVTAALKSAGLEPGTDPLELSMDPAELQFGASTYVGLRDLSAGVENPVRDALDHGAISAYAGHPYVSDEAVTLISTSQPFDEIANSLEDAGFERDGDVLSIEGSPEELTYTAVAPGDGFIVLGYDAETVAAVAAGEAEPSTTGELEALSELDGPVVIAVVPDEPECVRAIGAVDQADGTAELKVLIDGEADLRSFGPLDAGSAQSIGFALAKPAARDDTISVELEIDPDGSGLINSPAVLISSLLASPEQIYDCG